MKSILIVCFNDLKRDARLIRQIDFLKADYKLTVACFDANEEGTYEILRVKKTKLSFFRKALSSFFLLTGINKIAYRLLYDYQKYIPGLRERKFDLVLANDIEALPFAVEVANGHSKVYFDAHEYAPRQFEDRLYWRIFFKRFTHALCRKYIPKAHGMSTIGEGIAQAYTSYFGRKPIIITNAAAYSELTPIPATQYPIKLAHHGIFNVSRHPHLLLDMMKNLDDRFTLDLIFLLPNQASPQTVESFEKFKTEAEATGRINILPALKTAEIVSGLHAKYDMGIIITPPVNFNHENSVPNKFFDCMQARLALGVASSKEVANMVRKYDIGVVAEDFTAQGMAKAIGVLSLEDVNRFKQNTQKAAREMNAESNKTLLLADIQRVLAQAV